MNEMLNPIPHTIDTLRGKQVMLVFDLAALCQVETRRVSKRMKKSWVF